MVFWLIERQKTTFDCFRKVIDELCEALQFFDENGEEVENARKAVEKEEREWMYLE